MTKLLYNETYKASKEELEEFCLTYTVTLLCCLHAGYLFK